MISTNPIVIGLRKLAKQSPRIVLELPRNPVGLPEGSFILDSFLDYIADCLTGKTRPTSTGTLSKVPIEETDGDTG